MLKTFVLTLAVLTAMALPAHAGDIWVDDDGDNGTGTGSSSFPYKTVTYVLFNNLAAFGDVIKLKAGTYDEALGEVFPISLPSGVDLIGTEFDGSGVPLALIGGDVASSTVAALVMADASGSDKTGVNIEGLYFEGQDTVGLDAPPALYVKIRNGNDGNVTVEDCWCERPEMRDSAAADRATMLFDLGSGMSTLTVQNCTIYASNRAGVEVIAGSGATTSSSYADGYVNVFGNTIKLVGSATAEYGIRWGTDDAAWTYAHPVIRGNLIDSSGATGSGGIGTGISVAVAIDEGDVHVDHPQFEISRNQVTGCTQDGIELYNDPIDGNGHMSIWLLERNRVSDCGGAAMRIQKKGEGEDPDGGYINAVTGSNWWVDCDVGVQLVGGDASGPIVLVNDTITGNDTWGLQVVTVGGDSIPNGPSLFNCIVWGNGGCSNCDQVDPGDSDWPVSGVDIVEYCDVDNWSGGQGNIDQPPVFVNAGAGDYHLSSNSPCIDAGDNTPSAGVTITDLDIDNEDRTLDGDADNRDLVDMGADEYEP